MYSSGVENQLTIEDDAAYAMASELAELTGESLVVAVTEALRARLAAERQKRDKEEYIRRAREIAAEIRAHMPHPLPTSDHSDLYDENGLPV